MGMSPAEHRVVHDEANVPTRSPLPFALLPFGVREDDHRTAIVWEKGEPQGWHVVAYERDELQGVTELVVDLGSTFLVLAAHDRLQTRFPQAAKARRASMPSTTEL